MLSKLQELREEREEGFTLIELLVVILIIGILSAIAIPAFLNQRKSAVDSSVKADVVNAAKQIETWMIKNPSATVYDFSVADDNRDGTMEFSGAQGTLAKTASAIKDIKISDGTTISIAHGASRGTFTITGTNEGGDKATATNGGYAYDSASGGLQK